MSKWALNFRSKLPKKIFGVGFVAFWQNLLEFQISWKSGQIWPNFTNKKPFLFCKKILKTFLGPDRDRRDRKFWDDTDIDTKSEY